MHVGNARYMKNDDLPETVPVFPLPGALLLPEGHLPLNIFEPRYLAMIDTALAGHREKQDRGDRTPAMCQGGIAASSTFRMANNGPCCRALRANSHGRTDL